MPIVFEILGWFSIALGAWSTSTNARTLRRLIRVGKNEMIEPDLWRRAWQNVLLGPVAFLWGVFWVSYNWLHETLLWLPFAYVIMLAIWNVGSWFWLRNKVRSVS
jgi:hypothetical protein